MLKTSQPMYGETAHMGFDSSWHRGSMLWPGHGIGDQRCGLDETGRTALVAACHLACGDSSGWS
jgi:hypothetical protein